MQIRWPTLGLILGCYVVWIAALFVTPMGVALILLIPVIALQSSLQHEVLHGHLFANRALSEALVIGSLNLAIPYIRFRDTHLAHHTDATLTDPYDDPESNYLDPSTWAALPRSIRMVLVANNTLLGRMLIGPALGQITFMASDARLIWAGDRTVLFAWLIHFATALGIIAIVAASPMPLWLYALACYGGLGVLKIRTFLEHQAHVHARGRTVIIEDHGPLAFLFLNNNFHVIHHVHPEVPWYRLPHLYAANKDRYLRRNGGYCYDGYGQIFRRYFLRTKDTVAHPLMDKK